MANHCEAATAGYSSLFPHPAVSVLTGTGYWGSEHGFDGPAAFPQPFSHVVDGEKGTNLEADGRLERAVGPEVGFICHGVQEPFLTEQWLPSQ